MCLSVKGNEKYEEKERNRWEGQKREREREREKRERERREREREEREKRVRERMKGREREDADADHTHKCHNFFGKGKPMWPYFWSAKWLCYAAFTDAISTLKVLVTMRFGLEQFSQLQIWDFSWLGVVYTSD